MCCGVALRASLITAAGKLGTMEKAILKTLVYANLFDYPMKAWEIHKWLIGKQANTKDLEKGLVRLIKKDKVGFYQDFYFLNDRKMIVRKRKNREQISARFFLKAKLLAQVLRIIPWIKLIGVSGGLAVFNADKNDDIDLIVISSPNRVWLTRLLVISLLDFLGVRRRVRMDVVQSRGKICTNLFLEATKLAQTKRNLFIAHEVLQMKILWQREDIYSQYLMENSWAFGFLPNWATASNLNFKMPKAKRKTGRSFGNNRLNFFLNRIESWAKLFQLKVMIKPKGVERIEQGALYFHPKDYSSEILLAYITRIKNIF